MMLRRTPTSMLFLLASATAASAGVVITGSYSGTQTPTARTIEFRVQDGHAKITSQPGQAIYYDHAAKTLAIVDTEKGTILEMNEERAKELGEHAKEAQRMMEAKLKEMPPDQRAMVEKMMKEQGMTPGGGPPKRLQFAKSGAGKVGAWSCDRYSASGDGRKVDVCTSAPDALGVPPADLAVFEGFLDMSEKMSGAASGLGVSAEPDVPGLPLERTETRAGSVTGRFRIETIRQEALPAPEMKVPAGLKPLSMPGSPQAH